MSGKAFGKIKVDKAKCLIINMKLLAKHEDNVCKVCKDKFKFFMELLKHVAKYHNKETDDEVKVQGEEKGQNVAETKDVKKNQPFLFLESMLDKFLV